MAETPFSPEPGAPEAGQGPGEGIQGAPHEPSPAPQSPGYWVPPVESAPVEPQPEPVSEPPVAPTAEPVPAATPAADSESFPGSGLPSFGSPVPAAFEPAPVVESPDVPPTDPGAGVAPLEAPVPPAAEPSFAVEPPVAAPPADTPLPVEAVSQWIADTTPHTPAEPVAPEPPAEPPGVAATIAVPPLEGSEAGEGGEWELLLNRVTTWWSSGELGEQWQRIRGPLKGVAILVAVLLTLRVYATLVSTIDAIPLVSGLLELAGLITVLQFSATRLLRNSDREQVLAQLRRRWLDFRGRD